MIRTIAILSTIILAMTTSSAIAVEAEQEKEGTYPIWLSPHSPVKRLGDVDDAWYRAFKTNLVKGRYSSKGYALYRGKGDDRLVAAAGSCSTLIELVDQKFDLFPNSVDFQIYEQHIRECRYLDLLRKARPAKQSFLRDFELDEDALGVLPTFLEVTPSCQGRCQNWRADERSVPLSVAEEFAAVRRDGRFKLVLTNPVSDQLAAMGHKASPRGDSNIVLLGRADFTGDGFEDLAIQATAWSQPPASWWDKELFVLTRNRPGAVLQVTNPDQYLCPKYTCQTEFPWIDKMPTGPQ